MLLMATCAPTRALAQGVSGEYAPERGVRMPTAPPELGHTGDRVRDARRYREGQLVPPGHEVVTTYHGPLLGAGTALFGFHYILSVVLSQTDFRLGRDVRVRDEARNDALMAPLLGPFIALATERSRPVDEMALVALDGVAQIGSLAMAMSGLVLKQEWLMRSERDVSVRVSATGLRLALAF